MSEVETNNRTEAAPRLRSRVERPRGAAWVLIAIVALYAAVLLGGPLLAIVWGAVSSGFGAMARELTSAEALNALKLTLILSAGLRTYFEGEMTMTIHVQSNFSQLLMVCLMTMAVVISATSQSAYEQSIQTWRAEREAKLKAEDGWLTVSGLFWLKEGPNDFGADPANDIVLPVGTAPGRIGTFELRSGKVALRVAEGVKVTVNDKPVHELEVNSDATSKPDIIKAGDLSFILLKRGERYGIRLKDKNSAARRDFTGLRWYPVKDSFRVTAEFLPYQQPKEVPILNIIGDIEKYKSPGLLKFKLKGQEYTLEPVNSDNDRLFIILRDQTSGKTTYAASRFLYADKPKDGQVVLDFNRAINPPCAFTQYATCPLPPRQNRLNVAIEAGELIYQGAKEKSSIP